MYKKKSVDNTSVLRRAFSASRLAFFPVVNASEEKKRSHLRVFFYFFFTFILILLTAVNMTPHKPLIIATDKDHGSTISRFPGGKFINTIQIHNT